MDRKAGEREAERRAGKGAVAPRVMRQVRGGMGGGCRGMVAEMVFGF